MDHRTEPTNGAAAREAKTALHAGRPPTGAT
jgi:hypothetical protein